MTTDTVVAVGRVERGIRVGPWRADLLLAVPAPGEMLSAAARRLGEALAATHAGVPQPSVRIAALLPSGRPVVLGAAGPLAVSVSLSHERRLVGAAVSAEARVGIDIVDPEAVGPGLGHWFAGREQQSIPAAPLWAAKEAAYKAAGVDVAFHPGAVTISDAGAANFTWTLRSATRTVAGAGAWLSVGRHLVAVAGCPGPVSTGLPGTAVEAAACS